MINIKVILLLPLLVLILLYLPQLRNRTFYRLTLIGISAIGILFVLFPSVTDRLAHFVGVGRGADLITYLFIIFFFIAGIAFYSKVRKLEEQQTELVRRVALRNAQKLNQP